MSEREKIVRRLIDELRKDDGDDQFAGVRADGQALRDYLERARNADTRDHAMGFLSHARVRLGRVMKALNELSAMARHGAGAARQDLGGRDDEQRDVPVRFIPPPGLSTPVGGDLKAAGTAGLAASDTFWKSVRNTMSRPKPLQWW